jgi:alkylhydroperoxidase/carboxymuconolactone decarboxylase family protein YurZ
MSGPDAEGAGTTGHADVPGVSASFQAFLTQAPSHAQAWMEATQKLGAASALDEKTAALAYLAVLAAARLESGVPFHVAQAKAAGATREEVVSAILIGLPAAGNQVIAVLPAALAAYDAD